MKHNLKYKNNLLYIKKQWTTSHSFEWENILKIPCSIDYILDAILELHMRYFAEKIYSTFDIPWLISEGRQAFKIGGIDNWDYKAKNL